LKGVKSKWFLLVQDCGISSSRVVAWTSPLIYEELVSKARCMMSAKIDHDIKPREIELPLFLSTQDQNLCKACILFDIDGFPPMG
jgi:hypothetical protein